jgi:predicted nucleotidyltransferase
MSVHIDIPRKRIAEYCRKWKIEEFAFFGSVLREDFTADSDIDVLITFAPEAAWSLFDLVRMSDELEEIVGRKVDLITRRGLENSRNYLRREAILSSSEVLHVA